MNIVICGLKGTGKTTLSKKISEIFNFQYLSDYNICDNDINEQQVLKFIERNDNFVFDLNYSIQPKHCQKLKNTIFYFLGFAHVNENTLFEVFQANNENVSYDEVCEMITKSKMMKSECEKYNLHFYYINKDRKTIIDEILNQIRKSI